MLLPHSHPQLQAQQRRHTHQKPQQRPAQLHLVALEIRDLQGRTICLRYFFKVELSVTNLTLFVAYKVYFCSSLQHEWSR